MTINGTLTAAGASAIRRCFLRSSTLGTVRTLTAAAISANDCDFRDITLAGAAAGAAPTRAGNCGGNSGITFPAAKTVYRVGTNTTWQGSSSWALTSGGTGDNVNFPLAQDTAVIDNNSTFTGGTIAYNAVYSISAVDCSARTNALTLDNGFSALTMYGSYTLSSSITIINGGNIQFSGRGVMTFTTAGITMQSTFSVAAVTGTLRLLDAHTISGSFMGVTLTSGTLDLNGFTLTLATGPSITFESNNTNTRTLAFGTGSITIGGAGNTWNTPTTANMTVTGTPVVNITTAATSGTINVFPGSPAEANTVNFNFTAGTYTLNLGGGVVRNLNFTGFAGSWTVGTLSIVGNLTISTGMTLPASTSTLTFASTNATARTITSNGKTFDFPVTFNGSGGTHRLLDALTVGSTRTVTLTAGTLDLNNLTLTAGLFSSSGTSLRTIAFGTGSIALSSTGIVWNTATATNMAVTGTPVVSVTHNTTTATTVTLGSPTEANSISFNFTAGTYGLTLSGNARNLNFTGYAGALANSLRTVFGNLTVSTGMTLSSGNSATTFASTNASARTITTSGKTLDFPITFNGVGGAWQLQDALTLGSTRTLTHQDGTLNLNGFTLTVGTSYTTAAGTKNLTFNGGTLTCPGAGATAFNNAQPTNFTTTAGTGTGTINMTSASAKTFVGGGSTYNCTLNNGGAGALTITGSNTFTTLANSVQPTSFLFTAGTTTTLTNWSISGTASNLVTIGSPTTAQHILSKASGTVTTNYLSVSYSNATGGAVWDAGADSVDGGNNTGWVFATPPVTTQPNFFLLLS